jgi:hypothetical protein
MKFSDELPGGDRANRKYVDWDKAKADLIATPGMWGLIAEDVSATVPAQLQKGRYKAFRGDELEHFDFSVRRPKDADYRPRRSDLWGRYTPPKKVRVKK